MTDWKPIAEAKLDGSPHVVAAATKANAAVLHVFLAKWSSFDGCWLDATTRQIIGWPLHEPPHAASFVSSPPDIDRTEGPAPEAASAPPTNARH